MITASFINILTFKNMDLILFGMQGSGKGTLGKDLAATFDMQIFETGAEFRKLSTENSPLGLKIKSIIESGALVENDITMKIVENFIEHADLSKNIIFDGIPRSIIQATTFKELLKNYNRNYKAILLEIDEKTALKRLTTRKMCKTCKHIYPSSYHENVCNQILENGKVCNGELYTRKDDIPEAIKTRLDAYKKETIPALELFKDNMIVINGQPSEDGKSSIEIVRENAVNILSPILKK